MRAMRGIKVWRLFYGCLDSLSNYHWPGNVRELRNVIRKAVLLSEENASIQPEHLTFRSHLMPAKKKGFPAVSGKIYNGKESLKEIVKHLRDPFEKSVIEEVMAETEGNKSEAARRLKVDYKTLLKKVKVYRVDYALSSPAAQ